MLNFGNLNDYEFECLCKDVLNKMLDTNLRRFGKGKDGGIDLTNNVATKDIVVQVKHCYGSTYPTIKSNLNKEIEKVNKLKPKHYYVCCGKELTPDNVTEIYNMFSNFMESDKNVITLIEINDFLEKEENTDILQKHFKLWLSSTNVFSNLLTGDIDIDSKVFLDDSEKDSKYFVKTIAYEKALNCLEKNKSLFILGNPGVGKTITSKMLVLNFINEGYRLRYTTNGTDLAELKKSLSSNQEQKEIILLDDCLGQAYFNMKEYQEGQLISLIKYVNHSNNKLLIMNSRVTIYNEAKLKTFELEKSFENEDYIVHLLDMNNISDIEKAKIFYNHIYFNDISEEYFEDIKRNKNYLKIVQHKNYNPRLIEFVCNKKYYKNIECNKFYEFIIKNLKNPHKIWDSEYNERLDIVDKILLLTLYSLTETTINYNLLKDCFNYRLSKTDYIDKTKNHFMESLSRLNGSFVKIVDVNGDKCVSVLNPSVNDYLNSRLESNQLEKDEIKKHIISINQIERILDQNEKNIMLRAIMRDSSINNFHFKSEEIKEAVICVLLTRFKIYDKRYTDVVHNYFTHLTSCWGYFKVVALQIVECLTDDEMFNFYKLKDVINTKILNNIFKKGEYYDLIPIVNNLNIQFEDDEDINEELIDSLVDSIVTYYDNVSDLDTDFLDDYDIENIIEENMDEDKLDTDNAQLEVEELLKEGWRDELSENIDELNYNIRQEVKFEADSISFDNSSWAAENIIDDYINFNKNIGKDIVDGRDKESEIEYIFER